MIAKTSVLVANPPVSELNSSAPSVAKNIICGELFEFITKRKFLEASGPAAVRLVIPPKPLLALTRPLLARDQAALKHDLNILPGDLCGDYEGTPGFGNAWTTCSDSTVVRVTPPNSGEYTRCDSVNIVTGMRNTPLHVSGLLIRVTEYLFCRSRLLLLLPELDIRFREGGDRLPYNLL
ncbi:hypothetical protein B0H14DRAFT_2629448 [Mycena olivaceomarginata]|nr:hypothetical protein B0H14DRAFT_2629448 [Mycena olivaceomarginata]